MEQIKFLDLKPRGKILSHIYYAFDRVYNGGIYIGGKEVDTFEHEWADYCGADYCVGVGNGHDALALACRYIYEGFSPTHPPVAVPWKTCLPTWSAVENGQCCPVPESMRTDVKVAVHIYGDIHLPEHYDTNYLIEDCAQAHGAGRFEHQRAGNFGKAAAWSFYPTKNLGALGDAGAVTTDDESVAEYVREMSHYGKPDYPGINSRLDPVQAAILSAKLKYLHEWNNRRRENASTYFDMIAKNGKVELPENSPESCWHIFAIETDDRDGLRFFLKLNGVETMVHYWDVPYPPIWNIPEAERWTQRELSLPIAPHVGEKQIKYISKLINEWMGA